MTTFGTAASHIATTRDGTLVATLADQGGVTGDGVVPVWDTTTGELVFSARVGSRANNADWSPDGRLLAVAGGVGEDTAVTILDRSGATVAEFPVPGLLVGSLAFMPDGERILTTVESFGPYDPRLAAVVVWDWQTGAELQRIATGAWGAVPGPTQGTIVTAPHQKSDSQDVIVWNLEREEPLLTLTGHSGNIQFVAVDPSGSRIAAATGDGSIVVWDATTGELLLTLRGHTGFASYLSFNADGSQLASAGVDGTVRVWTLDRVELVRLARADLTRDLTDGECQVFLHTERCQTPELDVS